MVSQPYQLLYERWTPEASTASAAPPDIRPRLTSFELVTEEDISKLLFNLPAKSCSLDPVPTWFLKQLTVPMVPVICRLCNLSLQTGLFPSTLKHALVHPRTKKPTLNPGVVSNYRPISNLSFISKLAERIVARRVTSHIVEFNLLPTRQSAYRPYHSTVCTQRPCLRYRQQACIIIGSPGSQCCF